MRSHLPRRLAACSLPVLALLLAACEPVPLETTGTQLFASPQADPIAIDAAAGRAYVANTTSNTVSVIDTTSQLVVAEVEVGIDPVSVEVRPDGLELWVANHISDSVSVIDTDPVSDHYLQVIDTIDSYESIAQGGRSLFDEPVDIAFATLGPNVKAYVALSSSNTIATVDALTHEVTGSLDITAQDPRALSVRNGRLYVAAFESGNQSELSVCLNGGAPPNCTLSFNDLLGAAGNPNLPGVPKNVQVDSDVPDRDLFVFDTATDTQIAGSPVSGVGTLLYGLAVDGNDNVFVTNTEARNNNLEGNGLAAPAPDGTLQGLADLDNRIFLNRITRVDCSGAGCLGLGAGGDVWELEPSPPAQPAAGDQLATPYGIAVTSDDSKLVVTAAASSRIATVDASTGAVIDRLDVGAIPRGLALEDLGGGAHKAYVLNTLGNEVSIVDVAANGTLTLDTTVPVGADPTPSDVRLGRIAFNDASASSTGTFACAGCHPDAHVDQLLWVIGAGCDDGCDQQEPRTTMPVRGLRSTTPLHWDGTLGDPIGGINGEVGTNGPPVAANCTDADSCFRQLVDTSLMGVMCTQEDLDSGGVPDDCAVGTSGLPGALTLTERNNMGRFLQAVPYFPARERRLDDALSASALGGLSDFVLDKGGSGGGNAQTCADTTGGCHALPLGVSTNSIAVGAFDAPTMRGMNDRFVQFSGGFNSSTEVQDIAATLGFGDASWRDFGMDEFNVFNATFPAFNAAYNVFAGDMFSFFEEASTGYPGAYARQVTLNTRTAGPANRADTESLLAALEDADRRGAVTLQGRGLAAGFEPLELAYYADTDVYDGTLPYDRATLLDQAANGSVVVTLTAHLRENAGHPDHPQPLILQETDGSAGGMDPVIPIVTGPTTIRLRGETIRDGSTVLVDGQSTSGAVTCVGGSFAPFCTSGVVDVEITPSLANGMHVVQLLGDKGLLSNEMPVCGGSLAACQ